MQRQYKDVFLAIVVVDIGHCIGMGFEFLAKIPREVFVMTKF